jgi:hypothetical protein
MMVDQLAMAAGERGYPAPDGKMPASIAQLGIVNWRYGRVEGQKTAAPGTKEAI